MVNDATEARAPAMPPESSAGVMGEARLLLAEFRGLAHDHLQLATLEARQAAVSLVKMAGLGLLAAVFLLSAWLSLMGAATWYAVEQELLSGSLALALAAGLNLALALLLGFRIYRQSAHLKFAATARSLKALLADRANQENP